MIYSIGHGNKDIKQFLDELSSFEVKFLIDVRTRPYSRFWPHFDREHLQLKLQQDAIRYIFLGEKLGGLPNDPKCYSDGKVDYDLLKSNDAFLEGIERLINAHKQNLKVAVMCSESDPEQCHRSKAIGAVLEEEGISMTHIIARDISKDQATVMNELTRGRAGPDLFGEQPSFTSRKKYR